MFTRKSNEVERELEVILAHGKCRCVFGLRQWKRKTIFHKPEFQTTPKHPTTSPPAHHLLEPLLHLPQQRPHESRQVLDVLRVGVQRGRGGRSTRSRSRRRRSGRSCHIRHLHRCNLGLRKMKLSFEFSFSLFCPFGSFSRLFCPFGLFLG